ncbi:MAG TPA: hypothetical protein O0Y02_03240, partial [Methanocorpusculum sp.]|nr:hypothetical protein [Methanocorpusculum sp.]
ETADRRNHQGNEKITYHLFYRLLRNEMTNPPLAVRLRMQARKNIVIGWLSVWYAAAIPKKTAAQKNRMPGMSFVTSVIKKGGVMG